ncbi:amidohydrolase family protein [Planctomycetota bacterium]
MPDDRRPWLDTHIHVSAVGRDGQRRERLLDDLLEVLDRCDADLRFVLSPDGAELRRSINEPKGVHAANRFIHDLVREAPGRLYGSCNVNPHFLDESIRTMEVCFGEWGFVQLGEMLQYMMRYAMDSDAVERLVRLAVSFDVPVQVHLSTSNAMSHASSHGLDQLRDLFGCVERVPEAKYILAHAVGMPDDPPVVDQYLDVIERELGGWPDTFWMEIRDFDSPGVASALARVPTTRLIAGTDWTTRVGPPFLPYGTIFGVSRAEENPYPPSVAAMVGFLKRAGASDEDADGIAFRNAAELLGIEEETRC